MRIEGAALVLAGAWSCVPPTGGFGNLPKSEQSLFSRCSEPIAPVVCAESPDPFSRGECLGRQAAMFAEQPSRKGRREWLASRGCADEVIDGEAAVPRAQAPAVTERRTAAEPASNGAGVGERKSDGQACESSGECLSDLCVKSRCSTATLLAVGQHCLRSAECASDLCLRGVCASEDGADDLAASSEGGGGGGGIGPMVSGPVCEDRPEGRSW